MRITSMAYNGKNVQCQDQEILQTLFGKRARGIILKHNTVYLGDKYMNNGRKRNKN